MRFTLSKLFLAVAMAALACAGMISPNHWWANSILTLTVVLYVLVACRSIGMRGRDRVAAIAMAVFGGGYLLLVTCNEFRTIERSLVTNYPMALVASANGLAPTYQFAQAVPPPTYTPPLVINGQGYAIPPPMSPPVSITGQVYDPALTPSTMPQPAPPAAGLSNSWNPPNLVTRTIPLDAVIMLAMSQGDDVLPLSRFFLIGHCVWSWLIALAGAWFCGYVYSKRNTVSTT